MNETEYRIEKDSMGEVRVPKDALYAAQTQRAVENFPISGLRMPRAMIRALGLIKAAASRANAALGLMEAELANSVQVDAEEVVRGLHDADFPIDILQTGYGTCYN
ncbi:MAG: lyase family protein, partial [Gammaproteobacteria bacterium]